MKSLFGGSGQQSQSSSGGFNQLPSEIQGAWKGFASGLMPYMNNADAFKPIPKTEAEVKALGNINQGFAPTQQTINSDIAMQMNPFDTYVIDEINRQGTGNYSMLKQALNEAGQSGSNRQMLAANDIDLSRMNQIGQFKQGQFNTAMNNAMTTLPGARREDATMQMGGGAFERGLDLQTKQAGINSMLALAQAMGVLPKAEGSSTSTSSGNSSNGMASMAGDALSAYYLLSDQTLKENAKLLGQENGFNVYEFNYIGDNKRYIGVMAQEVEQILPEAVTEIEGYKAVNYDLIGIEFREVA